MIAGQDQVGPAVVVVIEEAKSPAAQRPCSLCDSGGGADIREEIAGFVAIERERLLVDVGHEKFLPPIAVQIRGIYTHPRARFSILAVGHAVFQPALLERLSL